MSLDTAYETSRIRVWNKLGSRQDVAEMDEWLAIINAIKEESLYTDTDYCITICDTFTYVRVPDKYTKIIHYPEDHRITNDNRDKLLQLGYRVFEGDDGKEWISWKDSADRE